MSVMHAGAGLHFDRYVGQAFDAREPRLVMIGRLRNVGDDRGGDPEVTGAEPPDMQVRHEIAVALESRADQRRAFEVWHDVE